MGTLRTDIYGVMLEMDELDLQVLSNAQMSLHSNKDMYPRDTGIYMMRTGSRGAGKVGAADAFETTPSMDAGTEGWWCLRTRRPSTSASEDIGPKVCLLVFGLGFTI